MPATATRRLLTATEAQIKSGRSMVRFRQWVAAGRLPFVVDEAGRRRFDTDDVDRLVAYVDRYKLEAPAIETSSPAPAVVDEPSSPLQAQVLGFLQASAERTQARSAFISNEGDFQ